MIINIGRKKYTATTGAGKKLHTSDYGAATKFLMGLKPDQSMDEFEYPGPGGRIRHNETGNDIAGFGVDGGGVNYRVCKECGQPTTTTARSISHHICSNEDCSEYKSYYHAPL